MGNSTKMDRQNYQMTDSRNVFCRFFYILVMLHKIMHSHFTDWNNKRKRKALGAGIYALTILPELLLLNGTLFAAAGQDGYVHLESDCQKVVFYGVSVLALLLMVIPLGFLDDKKIRKEVRQELREHPRYWKRAMVIYIAAIVALVVAVNIAFSSTTVERFIEISGKLKVLKRVTNSFLTSKSRNESSGRLQGSILKIERKCTIFPAFTAGLRGVFYNFVCK